MKGLKRPLLKSIWVVVKMMVSFLWGVHIKEDIDIDVDIDTDS